MKFSNEAKIGLLTILSLIILAVIVSWKSSLLLKANGYELTGSFTNIEGLNIGDQVRYRGFKVGKVTDIIPDPHNIVVKSIIDKKIKFPDDSYLRVAFDGLVGQKYLDIRPGTSDQNFTLTDVLEGKSTAGIVDFVDIGAQNLQETKRILQVVREFVENPMVKTAFTNAVLNSEKVSYEINRLTQELRALTQKVYALIGDPSFQSNVKGTIAETNKTLTSANTFFENIGTLNLNPSAIVRFGTAGNTVKANLDIGYTRQNYLRLGVGEVTAGQAISLLDLEFYRAINPAWGFHLGMINSKLGAGVDYYPSNKWLLGTEIYDISNQPSPKINFFSEYEVHKYINLTLSADDTFNPTRNYLLGIRVKGQ